LYLEVRCLGCDTHQTVALDIVRRPKSTPVHELERYMRCKDCSQVRGYPYKRSHLVALRTTKISASEPPSTWWRGALRDGTVINEKHSSYLACPGPLGACQRQRRNQGRMDCLGHADTR